MKQTKYSSKKQPFYLGVNIKMAEININNLDIVRAWKDEDYRNSLTEEQRSHLPNNPAGLIDLSDEEMRNVSGGGFTSVCWGSTRACWTIAIVQIE